jgi:hypothetical protein
VPRFPRTPFVVGAIAFALAAATWAALFAVRDARGAERFDVLRWELATLPNKWLYAAGEPWRDDPRDGGALTQYFALDDREGAAARRLENTVEAAIEGRIDAVLRAERLGWPAPPLPGVLPPVDVELAQAPRALVVSPRERIARERVETLRPDLPRSVAEALERRAEGTPPRRSALVIGTGGFATYPAVVDVGGSYADTVATAAHEWVHHYLALFALGRAYTDGGDAPVINETVADLAGDEIAARVLARWATPDGAATPAASAPPDDTDRTLRELRIEVDALLAAGAVERAEQRMETVRLELAARGVTIRRLNQAYFAWYGTYAARADSADPLGAQLRSLRERAGSLARFLALVRGVTTRGGVQALLEPAD